MRSRNVDTRLSTKGSPVTKEENYRRYAAELVDLASRTESNQQKRRLLAMAEAWLDLADRARRLSVQKTKRLKEHPLIASKLWSTEREAE
jgi:hypothetical protein